MKSATDAAFQATYSDWKLLRTRKVVQIVLEIPVETADLAYQVLGGMPLSGEEIWVGVARLDPNAGARIPPAREVASDPPDGEAPPPDRRPVSPDKRLVQQAGIACNDRLFQAFLGGLGMLASNPDEAATAVRLITGAKSRAEIVPGTYAAKKWEELYGKFLAWRGAPELVP